MNKKKVASELASIAKMLVASDVLSFSVPLLIRVMEYAKEDAETDMDLHVAVENMLQLSGEGKTLEMGDYDKIVAGQSKTAGSKIAASEIDLDELPADKKQFAQKLSSYTRARISQVFDGIHGHIVVFKGMNRIEPAVLLFIAKNRNVRWFEGDDDGFSIGM